MQRGDTLGAMLMVIALMLTAEVGAGFSGAEATIIDRTADSIVVEVIVARVDDGPVVAHLTLPGEEGVTVPMAVTDDGTRRAAPEIRPGNWSVIFEAVNEGILSERTDLVALGIDPVDIGGGATPKSDSSASDVTEEPLEAAALWAGVGAGVLAAALAMLLLTRKDGDGPGSPDPLPM